MYEVLYTLNCGPYTGNEEHIPALDDAAADVGDSGAVDEMDDIRDMVSVVDAGRD